MKKIEILGTGCPKCTKLAQNAEEAAKNCGMEYQIKKITDIMEITHYGVAMTPALVVDGEIKAVGKVPTVDEIKKLIS